MSLFKILLIVTAGIVAAHPEPTAAPYLENRADCAKITGALSVLKNLGAPATSFCSSYLKIPGTKTSTTTVTPVTTITTSTLTVTVTSDVCPNQKRKVPRDYRGLEFAQPGEDVEKRTDILALLAAFAAAKVSEGCICLGISPKTTIIATRTAATSTSNVLATTTKCTTLPAPVCRDLTEDCSQPNQCCTGLCQDFGFGPKCCGPPGDACSSYDEVSRCCSGLCLDSEEAGLDGACI